MTQDNAQAMGSDHIPAGLDVKGTDAQSPNRCRFRTIATTGTCCAAGYIATARLSFCSTSRPTWWLWSVIEPVVSNSGLG